MLPGSSRFGPGIVDDRQSSPSILSKRLIQPVKRAFTTSELPDTVTKKPPLPTRSVLSPGRQVFSPARDIMSPSRVFSPTREPSVLRDIFSPTRTSPDRDVFSPTRDYLSPSRSRSISVTSSVFGTSRDCSPASSFCTWSGSRNVLSSGSGGPRRMFPQVSTGVDLGALEGKDKAPVVFGAGLSFIIGGGKAKVRQKVRPVAAHLEPTTASSALSSKISEFLKKSDHVMDEWRRIGRKNPEQDLPPGIQSKSATNILIKGYQLYSQDRSSSCRSPHTHKAPQQDDDDTLDEADELSEMTADLAEEHSTATLATERLEAETSERLRLEKELQDVQHENKSLHQQGERLEMELLYMRAADMNGVGSEDEEDGEGDVGVYKQRYERAARELEFTKRRMQQQHEDDLEQLVGLKKQLEKKLADAYEEVEEQRQVVGQWKRKVQKLNAETNDLRLLLEEQSSRNNLLEKKQRKFDSELQLLQDELRQEKQQKERLSREKELAVAEKYTMEQNLGAVRLELELKEERVAALTQELDELMFGGKTEEEVAHLKKTKHELEKKVKEQEEELDDLAGQVQLLEQAKLRLEMSLEQQRKENRRETAQRDEELEDVRCNAHKKVKALEAQLESEHEERTLLLREKHELERRLSSMEEQERTTRATDEDQLHRLRRDLKRTKALLRDAQTMLERARGESPGKALIRQLRNQLEDAEFARSAAVKARQGAELELQEVQGQLEEAQRARSEAEERAVAANKERSELRTQLEENEEELAEVLKKYRAAVQQLSVDQLALQEQAGRVAELESERASLREQLAELGSRLESMETLGDPSSSLMQKRLELRTKELESKLELEQTTRSRLEVQITRLKEAVEKLQDEAASARAKEQLAQDNARKLQRTLRELREEHTSATAREAEAQQRRRDIEKRLETAEAEASAARGDLRLALTRIEDLQSAMQGELEDDLSNSDGENSESDHESEGSDESINTFLANHKVRVNSTPRAARPSFELDITSRSVEVTKKPTEASGKESFA
ncbi:unconventional myosin-XVIIIa isoform X6 [Anabrus simplex]|uniref:unconventional myosin-XVIIIa isoform X6 n=1 Tax=Anabrus simplex TaxID=316456 RepID=UPI0035A27AF5